MRTIYKPGKIESILAKASGFLNQLKSGLLKDMEESRRIQIEHANALKNRRLNQWNRKA